MSDAQYRALQSRAARNAQKYRMRAEKALNRVQLLLDRIARAKTVSSPEKYQNVFTAYDVFQSAVSDLNRALADLVVAR